jgi:hypothetical protein
MKRISVSFFVLIALFLPAQCNGGSYSLPRRLSELGIYSNQPADLLPQFIHYEINLPFWSDGAEKDRWFKLPAGEKIILRPNGEVDVPIGTMFIKEFTFAKDRARSLIEIRVLYVDGPHHVQGASYQWNKTTSEAEIVLQPKTEQVWDSDNRKQKNWFFPGPNDCQTCHTEAGGGVLGFKTRQINREVLSNGCFTNQIDALSERGFVKKDSALDTLARFFPLPDKNIPLPDRVRSYLDVNCAFCHHPGGSAGNFDARFEVPLEKQNFINGPVSIDLNLDGAKVIAPNDKWRSVLLLRLRALDGLKMPPLGHQSPDAEGIKLIENFIDSLPGEPVLDPPSLQTEQLTGNYFRILLRHTDGEAELRYTIDGSNPTAHSAIYERAVEVKAPVVIRARAYRNGYKRSISVQKVLTKS